ncbi:2540_t:CDS:2, partial [Entrophospora sp. SA101]
MTKNTHRLTKYIRVLGKQNQWNTYAVCVGCHEKLDTDELSKESFVNKKQQVKRHLKRCKHFLEKIGSQEEVDEIVNLTDNEKESLVSNKRRKIIELDSEMSSSFSSSSPSSVCHPTNKTKENLIRKFAVRNITKKEQSRFEELLLRMTVSNGFSFHWLIVVISLLLSGRKTLSNRILTNETTKLNSIRDQKLSSDEIGVTLAFDGWKNVLNQNLFGSLFITSLGEVLIWKALDTSFSDSAPAFAGARHQLRLQYPSIVFLPCFAHQCQLAICDIFKESSGFKASSAKAITVAGFFKNGNNAYYFIGKLRNIQMDLYNKYYSIVVPGETRWNSHYFCFNSLVHSKQALRHSQVAIELNPNEFYLNSTICNILIDNNWWETIETLQSILLPYCGVLNKLQCDKACLFEVLHALGYFINFWNNFFDSELGVKMVECFEKRWKQWEQPLFLLSFMLHPKYHFAYFNSNVENLSFTYLGKYLTYYYKAWFNKRPTRLLLDFEDYRQKTEPFDDDTYSQFNDD